MFGNIIRKSSATFAKFFNQPALAVAGGKSLNPSPLSKNFIDFSLADESKNPEAAKKKVNFELNEPDMKATNKTNQRDDPQGPSSEKLFKEPAMGSQQSNFGRKGVPDSRQHDKWIKDADKDRPSVDESNDPAKKYGEAFAKPVVRQEKRKL